MKIMNWLKIWFLGFAFLFIGSFCLIWYLNHSKNVPLRFTNSISFDAKLFYIKESKKLDNVEILIIGSSMGLNNINTEILASGINNENILNISSWGLKVHEIFDLLKLIDLSKVKKIIYINQYFDFYGESINEYDKETVKKYLHNEFDLIPYLNTFHTFTDNFKDYIEWKKRYININNYNNLKFNKYGDVNLFIDEDHNNLKRWNEVTDTQKLKNHFDSLENMIIYLNEKGIELLFITTPYREQFFSIDKFSNQYDKYLKKILDLNNVYNFEYINLQNRLNLSDNFFADSSHLNFLGANLVAEELVSIIKEKDTNKNMK